MPTVTRPGTQAAHAVAPKVADGVIRLMDDRTAWRGPAIALLGSSARKLGTYGGVLRAVRKARQLLRKSRPDLEIKIGYRDGLRGPHEVQIKFKS